MGLLDDHQYVRKHRQSTKTSFVTIAWAIFGGQVSFESIRTFVAKSYDVQDFLAKYQASLLKQILSFS